MSVPSVGDEVEVAPGRVFFVRLMVDLVLGSTKYIDEFTRLQKKQAGST